VRPNLTTFADALQVAGRAGVAAGLSVMAARWFGLPYPIYALLAAVIVTDPSSYQTRQLGLQRLVGTALGATWGAAFSLVFAQSFWAIGSSVLTVMALCHLVRLRDSAKVAGYVAGIVLLEHAGHPWVYATYRFAETGLGIGFAFAVSSALVDGPRMMARWRGVEEPDPGAGVPGATGGGRAGHPEAGE